MEFFSLFKISQITQTKDKLDKINLIYMFIVPNNFVFYNNKNGQNRSKNGKIDI